MESLNPNTPGRKLAAIAAILSLPFAYLTQILFMAASDGDVSIFHNGEQMMALSADKAAMFSAAMWIDILGYYLIFLPVIIYAWKALRHIDESLTDITFLCGLIYCLLGSFGAVQMAGAFEALLTDPVNGSTIGHSTAAWEATIGANWRGLWLLEAILAAIWFGGLAKLLNVIGFTRLGICAGILAVLWIVQFAGWHAGLVAMSDAALALVVMLSPLWSVWLGITLLRHRRPIT